MASLAEFVSFLRAWMSSLTWSQAFLQTVWMSSLMEFVSFLKGLDVFSRGGGFSDALVFLLYAPIDKSYNTNH